MSYTLFIKFKFKILLFNTVALGVHFALLFFLSSSRRSTENVFPGSANSCCSFARIASASAVGERWGREEGGGWGGRRRGNKV